MKSVEIIMLPVADRQKAKEFYLKLGFEVIVEAPLHTARCGYKWDYPEAISPFRFPAPMASSTTRPISKKRLQRFRGKE